MARVMVMVFRLLDMHSETPLFTLTLSLRERGLLTG